ncbi:hypothetical protein KP509_01G015700 [Ceratopteris richardii]|uniref:Dirigent protein n=1 Tax=Ceratopteris richardii TaxID=49495 RepID=A0A8T2VM93_CERRI|nr:hypothetical protein KP509_01G015700 [Ceratopteris richardii]
MVQGYTMQSSYTRASIGVEVEVLIYNDGTLSGTIIQSSDTEVAIVGGTGDFRGVKGYGVITFANAIATNLIFHHQLGYVPSLVNQKEHYQLMQDEASMLIHVDESIYLYALIFILCMTSSLLALCTYVYPMYEGVLSNFVLNREEKNFAKSLAHAKVHKEGR